MKVHNPLNKILDNKIKIKVLRFLCRTDAEWNGRQIAREIKISPASCHKALRELNNEGVLLLRSIGRNYLYRLNNKNIIVSDLLKPLYQMEKKLPGILFNIIKRGFSVSVKKNIASLAVFGSFSQKEEQAASDIDLLVLLTDIRNKKAVVEEFKKINERVLSKFGNITSPYILSVKEFKSKYRRKLPVVKGILQSHRLLLGKSLKEFL